ncbi:MAG TPA: thiamine pyrophosphate-binding protein [Acidimicrobiales bacterium]|nr:thiamine pyrophosphate-binding protein [Acidimicrobiales bacterium]
MSPRGRPEWGGGVAASSPARVNGGELMAEALRREGVTHLFGLGGGHINPTWWAAPSAGITIVDVRHEAAAAHAAEGWALATGDVGVCIVTAGPGLTNAVTGLANAFNNGSPMVCLAGSATLRGQDTGEVEMLDQMAIAGTVTKWARRVYHVDRIPEYVAMAFTEARSGRPGPVYLEVPIDLIHSDVATADVVFPSRVEPQRQLPDPALVARAADVLSSAKRPAIVAGSGVWWSRAAAELRAFVERTGVPIVTRQSARGTVPDDHPLCFGNDWQSVVYRADTLLVVGKQLDYFFGYGFFPHLEHLVQVDVNPAEIGRNRVPVSVGIVGDAGATLSELTAAMKPLPTEEWVAALREAAGATAAGKDALAASDRTPVHPMRVCRELQSLLRRDATVVADASNMLMWANAGIAAYTGGCNPAMSNLGCIGHGVAFALAAACARPGTQVVWLVGDGSFGFNAMELDTAARFGLPVTTVVLNNLGWSGQWVPLGVRHYERLAPGFDGVGELVEEPAQLRPALERALAFEGPSIVNVLVDPEPEYFPGRFLG